MELKEYITPLRRWWWLILATTLVAAVSSFLATRPQPPIYRASATLMIGSALANPNPTGGEFVLAQQLAQTYVDLANLSQLREATRTNLGISRLPEYMVTHQTNTQLIKIDVTDTSPERAMVVANELAHQLILRSPTSTTQENQARQAFVNQELDDLQVEIQKTKDEITIKQQELADSFSAREISELQNSISALENKLNAMQTNYASLLDSTQQGATNAISVVQEATIPVSPIGPNKQLTIIATALVGFVLATGAAYLLEYLDDTVTSPEEVEQECGLPTLGGIARIKSIEDKYELITVKEPRSPNAEAYRGVRTGIQFSNVDKSNRIILVTSANPSEGKSLTAANLAVVMGQAGYDTLLIDADLRRPVQHRIFGLHKDRGLTNFLLALELDLTNRVENQGFQEFIQQTERPGLYLLPSGSIPPNPSELLGSAKMKAALDVLSKRFDYIIIDSPPILAVTDAVVLSTQVDSVMLIINSGNTRRTQLRRAVERLREVNANLIGVTLNRLTRKNEAYYYYYYSDEPYFIDESEHDLVGSHPTNGNGHSNGFLSKLVWRREKSLPKEDK